MEGPKAPRDPEKMRPYFYILKDKEIFGSKQEDGTGIQFVYESDGRLINSAQIAGNITDQEELALLENVEGFRKLVQDRKSTRLNSSHPSSSRMPSSA